MPRIVKERDRLLFATSRAMGIAISAAAFVCLALPGSLPTPDYIVALACVVLQGVGFWALARSRSLGWVIGIVLLGLVAIVVIGAAGPANLATESALPLVAAGCASVAIVLGTSRRRFALLAACCAATVAAVAFGALATGSSVLKPVAGTVAAWACATILAVWLGQIVPQTVRRIAGMSDAYRTERRASEQETKRRQSARLLHDTVLATLTLLAHSGRGVGEDALREQAAEDAALLRQLRLGYTPIPESSGDYKLRPSVESTLGNTLESVKQRFRRMGLDVAWHGTGHVLLPSDRLEAFLLALAECLENVRRHSGVDEAHVTITDDEQTVRAMVTDAGIGFDLAEVAPGRLGFAESIVARLREVGGNARLFSSPGSGTTVVLEVPK